MCACACVEWWWLWWGGDGGRARAGGPVSRAWAWAQQHSAHMHAVVGHTTWASQRSTVASLTTRDPVRPHPTTTPLPPCSYLAVLLAARRPDLVRGLLLLNATPFWAFRPAQGTEAARGALWRALDGAVEGSVPVPEVRRLEQGQCIRGYDSGPVSCTL